MADKQVQIRKGNTAANDAFTGALGELSCDTQQNRLRVHDGATPGGFPHALKSEVDSKEPLLGFTPENVSNKAVDFSVLNNTLYPTTLAVSSFVATGAPPFVDTQTIIKGSVDPTKLLRFEVDGFTAGATRVLTPQDANYVVAGVDISNTFVANQSVNGNIVLNTDGSAAFGTAGLITISAAGVIGFPDGVRQTFNPNGTTPGLNVGSQVGDPSTPANGDIWYDSTGNLLRARINGATVSLGVSATPGGADTQVQFNDGGSAFGGDAGFSYNKTSDLITSLKTAIGATPADSLQLINNTAAAAGAQQYSPALRFSAQGWKTNATAASQQVDWRVFNQPEQQTANPTTHLIFQSQINGGGFITQLDLRSSGELVVTGPVTTGSYIQIPNTSVFAFGNRTQIKSSGDGLLELTDSGGTTFSRLNFGGTTSSFPSIRRTTTALNIRLADNSADAALTALSISTSQATFMHITTAALNDGAGGSLGTLTNAPAAGNPTKWIPVNDNGTTRYIPAW